MSLINAPRWWLAPLDLSSAVRPWIQDSAGAQRRLNNAAAHVQALAAKINHLAARQGRPVFAQGWREASVDHVGADPLASWIFGDYVANARSRTIHILALPRREGTGEARALVAPAQTPDFPATVTAPAWPEDLFYCRIDIARGVAADAFILETVATSNGFTVVDMSIQEDAISVLDTDMHLAAQAGEAASGGEVYVGPLESCRAVLHGCRRQNLGVEICWSACGTSEGWANATVPTGNALPAGGDHRGMWLTTPTFKNVLDTSISSRTASSPGIHCLAYRAGIGAEYLDRGASVPLFCAVFGHAVGHAATVRFVGPDHVANNYVDVSIPVAGGSTWHYAATNLRLNANATDDDETTARNKVDIIAKVGDSGDDLFIHGLHAERVWAAI